jgi:two-component system cell cycle response regulator DivK
MNRPQGGVNVVSKLLGAPILVVEDDPASTKLLSVLLTEAGAEVAIALDAKKALLMLHGFRPRLILLDLVLPRVGGLVLLEKLMADPFTRNIPVIAVTAVNGPEVERKVMKAGCAGYLRKPIDVQTFTESISQFLE